MPLKVYFHGAYRKRDVGPDESVPMSLSGARDVFARIGDPGSFMGIELGDERILQFCREDDGTIHTEVLWMHDRRIRFARLNAPLAEMVLEAALRDADIEEAIAFSRVEWHSEKLEQDRVDNKAAEPGATDNPDDAQRLREDY